MAARGKKKLKKQSAAKVPKATVREEKVYSVEKEKDVSNLDLETMEKMLANDGSNSESDGDESMGDEDFNDENSIENESDDEEEEVSDDESMDEEETNDDTEEEDNIVEGEEKCNLDLRNLLATNSHQVNQKKLYKKDVEENITSTTICVNGIKTANEEYLLQKASEGCAQLLSGLWKLETEKTDAGPMAELPTYVEIVTPRELPPPQQQKETKWEKFAKERGIAPKEKRSRKVWDEATQSWGHRTGFDKAASANNPESWPIMEVKGNDDPFEDPWERARDAKKERVDKNTVNRMRNAEKNGQLERGTTRRVMKAKTEAREKGREGGKKDMKNFNNAPPAGLPLDLVDGKQRGKELTKVALMATQRSTASLGKFDKMREGEPERRKAMAGLKKRKFDSATSENVVKSEAKKSLKVLDNVFSGGGKVKERAIKRGQYAKGETGHDYDFDDGLGPSSYKKKKGRAGIGKMSKVTKKMAK
mmetsp:Transcript_418/g.443  ORF Transcript_418/g.443 Transcript_418/m.443 type:complete len:477 (+) Transcript_418:133-1563(+)